MAKAKGSSTKKTDDADEVKKSRVRTTASSNTGGSARAKGTKNKKSTASTNMSDVAAQIIESTTNILKEEIGMVDRLNPFDLGAIGSKMGDTPASIVVEAANILNEELMRGFDTASKIGGKLGKGDMRSLTDQEVIERFRDQAHSAVDAFINLVNMASVPVNGLAGSVFPGDADSEESIGASSPAASTGVPSFSVDRTASPGGKIEVSMTLENEGDDVTERFDLFCSDLQSPSGDRIASEFVSFEPRTVVLAPGKSKKVKVVIDVPEKTSVGTYSGLLQSTEEEGMRAVLSIKVV